MEHYMVRLEVLWGRGRKRTETSGRGGLHPFLSPRFQTVGDRPLHTNQGSIESFLSPSNKLLLFYCSFFEFLKHQNP